MIAAGSAGGGPLALDLQAAQSPTYRERGVARYAMDYAAALVGTAPGLVDQVLFRSDLPAVRLPEVLGPELVSDRADWTRPGGVFHALSPFDLDTPVRTLWPREASRTGRRLVVTVYDLIPELFPETYLADPGTRRRYRARRELIRAADHVVTLSRSAADDVADRLGVPDHRLSVVGAACSERFRPGGPAVAEAERARALVPGLGDRTVVYNGAVEPRKNMERLIRAFAHLPADLLGRHQLVLVCGLRPLERHHYEVLGRELGLPDGGLLLTGTVPDDALVHLYRSARLVVFPSLYEGYGLPVAEAMACGAPVVASGTSSLRELVAGEARFDPLDTSAITRALERGLTDEPFRQRLAAWSVRPRPTWQDVAERAVDVYRRVGLDPSTGRARRPAAWRRRPRMALVTPWPPALSGVATYSRRLAAALATTVDVEVFVDGVDGSPGDADRHPSYPAQAFPIADRVAGGYDAVVACVGNSEHHTGALRLVRVDHVPAAVMAHEVRLNGLYRHGAARGAVPEGNAAVVAELYGPAATSWVSEGWVPPAAAEAHGVHMARELIGLAHPFIVTSEYAASVARVEARPADRDRVVVCPFAYPPPSPRPAGAEQHGLVCTFGLVNPVKQPDLVLAAFALAHLDVPGTRLAFVGPVDPSLREHYHALAVQLGVAGAVTFTGTVDDAEYERWLARASLALQLRATSNGESSSAVADCLAHGVVTVVTDAGPADELPDFVTKVPAGAGPESVAAALRPLLDDAGERAARAERGLQFVADHGFERSARRLVEVLGLTGWASERSTSA